MTTEPSLDFGLPEDDTTVLTYKVTASAIRSKVKRMVDEKYAEKIRQEKENGEVAFFFVLVIVAVAGYVAYTHFQETYCVCSPQWMRDRLENERSNAIARIDRDRVFERERYSNETRVLKNRVAELTNVIQFCPSMCDSAEGKEACPSLCAFRKKEELVREENQKQALANLAEYWKRQ